jgi:hypothetical protein
VKVVLAVLSGIPQMGDVVDLHHMSPSGGRSTAGHIVESDSETLEYIASKLAESAGRPGSWTPSIEAKAKGCNITIIAPENLTFVPEITSKSEVPIRINLMDL